MAPELTASSKSPIVGQISPQHSSPKHLKEDADRPNKKARFCVLDALKVFAIMGVIALHTLLPHQFEGSGELGNYINIVSRLGLPVFFLVSGFFSLNTTALKLVIRALKMVGILVVGVAGYAGLAWYLGAPDVTPELIQSKIDFQSILLGTVYYGYHLWFLIVLAEVYLVLALFRLLKVPLAVMLIIALGLLVFRWYYAEFVHVLPDFLLAFLAQDQHLINLIKWYDEVPVLLICGVQLHFLGFRL